MTTRLTDGDCADHSVDCSVVEDFNPRVAELAEALGNLAFEYDDGPDNVIFRLPINPDAPDRLASAVLHALRTLPSTFSGYQGEIKMLAHGLPISEPSKPDSDAERNLYLSKCRELRISPDSGVVFKGLSSVGGVEIMSFGCFPMLIRGERPHMITFEIKDSPFPLERFKNRLNDAVDAGYVVSRGNLVTSQAFVEFNPANPNTAVSLKMPYYLRSPEDIAWHPLIPWFRNLRDVYCDQMMLDFPHTGPS